MEPKLVTIGFLVECVALSVMTTGILPNQYHHLLYGAVERQEGGSRPCAGQTVQVTTFFFAFAKYTLRIKVT